MSDPAKHSDSNDEPVLSVRDWRLEETAPCATAPSDYEIPERSKLLKPVHDLAYAVALRDSGLVTEGQLSMATRDWTAFGSKTLAEHVVSKSLANEKQSAAIQRSSDAAFQRASRRSASQPNSNEDPQGVLIEALNPDGKLASLLGLTNSSAIVRGSIVDRSVGAKYTLLRKIGQGGLGTVWLAKDENLNRYVAVKELSGDPNQSEVALEHFRREAEITGRLEHPGIVPIHQFGYDEKSGRAFYAMRFLGRRTLQDAIDEYHERREAGSADKMALHRLLTSFVSVCHSVGHAHSRKVIHRDLKPANVALDEFGQVTLLDWGLSKVNEETGMYEVSGRSEPGDLHDLSSAQAGRVIGTPLYMAPEQAAGRLEDVDALTDVYGLGGILYTILTGVGPHHASDESGQGGGREQFLTRIVTEDVQRPSGRRSAVPPELDAICMKALSRQRFRRYRTAAELADDLQRYMAGTPVEAYEAPLKRRLSWWMMRHPTLAQMILLAGSLILIGLVAVALTAKSGRERLLASRFASVSETAHDMEDNLRFEANALQRDLHFVTELPLMQAIAESQMALTSADSNDDSAGNTPTAAPLVTSILGSSKTESIDVRIQSPDQWLDRQGELFDGFLDANPAYLMLVSCKRDTDHFRELVRSERSLAGHRAKRVPKQQLKTTKPSTDSKDAEFINLLESRNSFLLTNDRLPEHTPSRNRNPLVLSAVSAVYDTSGAFFGINVIELDLQERLRTLIPAVAPEYINVFVTDREGRILLDYREGRFVKASGSQMIGTQFPEIGELFVQADGPMEWSDDRRFYAKLVDLGDSVSQARIGIVTYSSEN